MDIVYLGEKAGRYLIETKRSGNSNAVHVPADFNSMTVMLSSVSGGVAKVQFTLSPEDRVKDDTAIWHDWSKGDVTSTGGISFDSPVSYLRIIANNSVSYTLEMLI